MVVLPASTPNFYPRPPRGGRHWFFTVDNKTELFLSTPSARRATYMALKANGGDQFLSTPSARRATTINSLLVNGQEIFLSTPSARRATLWP